MNDGLIKQIELAINDPGSVIGERLNNGVTYEPLATWQARAVIATIADSVEGVGKPYPVEERAFHVVRASYGEELEHFRAADRATLSSFPATSRDDAYAMAKALNHVVRFHVERAQALSTPAQGDEVREALHLAERAISRARNEVAASDLKAHLITAEHAVIAALGSKADGA